MSTASAKFIQTPIPSPHLSPPKSTTLTRIMKLHVASHHWCSCSIRFGEKPTCEISVTKISAAQTEQLASDDDGNGDDEVIMTQATDVAQLKQELYASLQGIDRGIFGVESTKKNLIEGLVELLESQNPNPQPTLCLDKVSGAWKLIYSTITILGSKRTKLGLRDFITLGDFLQNIIIDEGKAINVIKFSARGLNLLSGQLTIDASFKVASPSRVDISYNKSVITPEQLMNMFRKNYEMLLSIFNPQGWLEITYVDAALRIGRDDKGNIFILERVEEKDTS